MGRWKMHDHGQRQVMATVSMQRDGKRWKISRTSGVSAFESADSDTSRIWWSEAGVHQNLTFPVHPDPISGMHCWHQAVYVTRAEAGDRYGDIVVDAEKASDVFERWLAMTRPASRHSPDGTRRPRWMLRPLKPSPDAYKLAKP